MIKSLVPNFDRDEVLKRLKAIELPEEIRKDSVKNVIGEFAKEVIVKASSEGLMQIIGLLMV